MPPIFRYLIDEYGWRGCLLISATIYCHICACGALLRPSPSEKRMRNDTKESLKDARSYEDRLESSRGLRYYCGGNSVLSRLKQMFQTCNMFHTNTRFIAYIIAGLLSGMCFSIPDMYLVPKAVHNGMTKTQASFIISQFGLGSMIGKLSGGFLADHSLFPLSILFGISHLITGMLALIFPIGQTFTRTSVMSVLLGICAGNCHALYPLVAKDFVGLDKTTMAMSWYNIAYAVGCSLNIVLAGKPPHQSVKSIRSNSEDLKKL